MRYNTFYKSVRYKSLHIKYSCKFPHGHYKVNARASEM